MPFLLRILALAASATLFASSVHADAGDSDERPPRLEPEVPVARRRPLELGVAVTFGISDVADSTFHATRVNGDKVSASGADLGYERPSVLGLKAHGAYFPFERLGLGLYLGVGGGWGASDGSAIATETRPVSFDFMALGTLAEIVVIDGPLSLRVESAFGVRLANIGLDSPAYAFSRHRRGSATAVDLVASPRAMLIQRFGMYGEFGAFFGPDFVTTEARGPAWTSGLMMAIR
jgi:hypothetical protein